MDADQGREAISVMIDLDVEKDQPLCNYFSCRMIRA